MTDQVRNTSAERCGTIAEERRALYPRQPKPKRRNPEPGPQPHAWTAEEDATALALYHGDIDYMEAHRRTGIGPKRLRRHAYELIRGARPSAAERKRATALPFGPSGPYRPAV